ncbi:MAG: hypothetical protein HZC17_08260 [Candidatus Omnitrophica bacterium]|nr:hypothetical protein [Candidatus Omnitrophota bacterium]
MHMEGAAMEEEKVIKQEDRKDREKKIVEKQNEFLDVYSLYLRTGSDWIKQEAILKAYELHVLDSKFTIEI